MDAFRKLLDSICERPAMYVGLRSFVDAAHYLAGYCHGLDDANSELKPLDGFVRWVEMRFVIFSPAWHWTRILLHNYGDDTACFNAFPDLFDQFIADRERLGVSGIESELKRCLIEKYGQEFGCPEHTRTTTVSER